VVRLQDATTAVIAAHSSIALSAATTYHIVAVKSGALVKLYINGVDRTVVDNPVTFANTTTPIAIGRSSTAASNFFDGKLDEVVLFGHPLTAAQVLGRYNTGQNIL
jgi:hypothetical protein